MKPARRKLIIAAGVIVALMVAVAVGVHLPGVQRSIWSRLSGSIEEDTGWRISAETFALRAVPARLRMGGVTAAHGGRTVVSLDRVEASWSWLALSRAPHRLDRLVVDGVDVDAGALPERSTTGADSTLSFWDLLEIGEFRILGFGGTESISGIDATVDGLNIDGQLMSGSGRAEITAQRLLVDRDGRLLDLGSVDIKGRASPVGLKLERLEIGSPVIRLSVTGQARLSPALSGRFDVTTEADIGAVARWWDPNLASGLEPRGRLELEGQVAVTEAGGVRLELAHRGRPLHAAGYELEELELEFDEGEPRIRAAHPDWGRMEVTMVAPGAAEVAATFDEAPIDRMLAFAAPRVAAVVGQPATLSGEIDGTASFPIVPELLAGRVDLEMRSPLGQFGVRAEGAGLSWQLAELSARAMNASLRASGRLDEGESISGEGLVTATEPGRVAESAARFLSAIQELEIGGGPIESRFRVGGSLSAPKFSATLAWVEPLIDGRLLDRAEAEASGGLEGVEWELVLSVADQSSFVASGLVDPRDGSAEGRWEIEADSIGELMAVAAVSSEIPIEGRIGARGGFEVACESIHLDGEIVVPELSAGEWSVRNLRGEFAATPDAVVVKQLSVHAYSGVVEGELRAPLADLTAPVGADLRWQGIDLSAIPIEVPEAAGGVATGRLRVEGSLANPEGDLEIVWLPRSGTPVVGEVRLLAGLTDGVLSMVSESIESVAGVASVELVAPLGDLPLQEWLWPDAPGGAAKMTAEIPDFSTGPLQEMFGVEDLRAVAEADLRAELLWNALAPDRPHVILEARDLRVLHPSGNLVAEGPLVVSVDDDRIQLDPVVLVGLGSRIEASAVYDPATEVVDGRLRARLAPEVTAMVPIPVILEGPLTVNADFEVPADRAMSLPAVRGELTIDHRGGRMVMRDPPFEIRDLRAVATLQEGVFDILEGSAEVNRGHVDLGGGWDPKSGQGLVLELDNVTTMVEGILTEWDGEIAIEPHADRLAHISGDLTLVAGLWDERFDLASAMLAGPSSMSPEEEILHDISLDVLVQGLAGVKVENNLGRFDVNWDRLRVAGTAAAPILRGELRIAPGGVLALAGQEVEVRRGVVEFTGNPDIDPLIEIVPVSGTTVFGDEEGIGATEMATRGVAQGISSALGFENETLRPAEIAVQTESDPSVRFMVGQRLSRQLALFFAFNLTEVQDRLTMLQYWNMPRFKGLALQAYQDTADENVGANLLKRFEWGGSRKLTDRPEIHRLRLDGEWPISKRGLRKATRLRRGQPFDPFLLFVGAVRMERMLAEHGYQNARVTGVLEGREASPTLVFTCSPGDPQPVEFEGDSLPGQVRREITAMYQRPPLESGSFDNMVSEVRRHVVGEGFLASDIAIERRGESVVVNVRKGEKTELEGPFFDGMPVDAVMPAFRALASPEALALAVDRPDWAAGVEFPI